MCEYMGRNRHGRLIGIRDVGRLADVATPSTPTVAHAHLYCQSGTPLGLPITAAPCMKLDANTQQLDRLPSPRGVVRLLSARRTAAHFQLDTSTWLMQTINPRTQ